MRIVFYTLGCKANRADTREYKRALLQRGHSEVLRGEPADAVVLNSCCVTHTAESKTRKAARALRRQYPRALLAVCGCMPAYKDAPRPPEADVYIGGADSEARARLIDALEGPEGRSAEPRAPGKPLRERARAYLKIQDGCAAGCAYCVIPLTRGRPRRLREEDIAERARELVSEGCREIVLTGMEISSLGADLTRLLTRLPPVRLRLGSLDPADVTREMADGFARVAGLCPHFHLSLQSGCDATLRRMKRRYDTARYGEAVALLRERFRECAVTTDIMAGFPGETEEDFAQTAEFMEKMRFARAHIFPYSPRPGTAAASMPGQVSAAAKKARCAKAEETARAAAREYRAAHIGKTLNVLFEADGKGRAENYLRVRASSAAATRNSLWVVAITGCEGEELTGEPLREI
ncbi:MAG: MiaB/RimO family radical SAM methylthiotransferase [Oscillospiraceae bacterium]|jgi:threonylcarbamoyladenosine tRNA methylthiotransferase MtaB|nr:MiaB/RimO family radical SAM methylthiotransferase [Oscillospiraceae bacterium]